MTSASPTTTHEIPLPRVFTRRISRPGLITGVLFFVVSLLPSMLPRSSITQGVVSGIAFMIGYALGAAWQWAWNFLELPSPKSRVWRIIVVVWYVALAVLVVSGMWRFVGWQNDVRDLFGMDRISAAVWLTVIPVTIAVAALILIVARSLRKLFHLITRWLGRHLRRRQALLLGGVVLALLLWGVWSGILVNGFFAGANQIFAPRDTATDEGSSNRSRRTGPAARSPLFPGRAWVGRVAPSSLPGLPSRSSTPTTAGTLLSRSGCTPG